MEVHVVPSTVGGGQGQFLAGLLVNDAVAVDAGAVGLYRPPDAQARVRHVLLTHSHIDHIASLPILLDNVYRLGDECVTVYGLPPTLDALRTDVFNGRLMPDLSAVRPPFVWTVEVAADRPFVVAGLRVTPLPVDHVVPTVAYLLEDAGGVGVGYVTDTRSADVVGPMRDRCPGLRGVFLEASFPTRLADLAADTGHLTAAQFLAAADRLGPGVRVLAVHVKPRYYHEVAAEVAAAGRPHVGLAHPGRTYTFP